MAKYKVKEALSHNGENYLPGDTIEMSAKEATPLIDLKVLAAEKKAPEKKAPEKKPPEKKPAEKKPAESKAGLKVVE